ncbi:hypothetical protein CI109_101169 [Kwoniella shandongensis]|uniref:Uncharacterized protein n=1 Tax=Kwoniella shandongensis TaxID=1734106 RepID=A0A5M6C612_9TREE|nr:uncharacterized protein CI109_001638 [Kwoniella shandongensis]KAA5530231.1 hypothetical protein CI109_001638 [Kwoniella shandongensis]
MSNCCQTIPPVLAEYPKPKGKWTELNGLKTYVTGPEDAKKSLLIIYDIFGFSNQLIQGADLLASQGYRVTMPDFLLGDHPTMAMFQPGGEEDRAKYFSKFPGNQQSQSEAIGKALTAIKAPGVEKTAVIGLCWGYKAMVVAENINETDAIIGVHPTFPAPEDGDLINKPSLIIATAGEEPAVMEAIHAKVNAKLPGKNVYHHFPDRIHGFAGSRADLNDPVKREEFAEAYQIIAKFLKDTI